jgi:dipeptidyl aminopeptidase/acylaminoacyl peptidase
MMPGTHCVARGGFCRSVLLVALIVVAATAAQAQSFDSAQDRQGLTSDSLWRWEFVGGVEISPDGTKIAYVQISVAEDKDTYRSAIWVAELPSGRLQQMSASDARNFSPRWSPDGTRLAFLSTRGGGAPQIYILAMDGGEARQVTQLKNGAGNIEWSPDGKWLAFTSLVSPKVEEEKREPGKERAPKEKIITRLRYRFDGAGYLPEGYAHIFVVSAEGGPSAPLGTSEPRQLTAGDFHDGAPAWSPDGKQIAFSAVRKPDAEHQMNDSEIYVVPVEGGTSGSLSAGEPKALTDRRGPDANPVWSPDGKRIAYVGMDENLRSYDVMRLYVMEADGSGRRELTGGLVWDLSVGDGVTGDVAAPYGGMGADVQWSPDGKRILFISAGRGNANIFAVPADGGEISPVTRGDHALEGFSVARNGQAAAIMATLTDPFDIYAFSLDNPELRRLTNVNAANLKDRALSKAEGFWYSAFDNHNTQGWVMKPVGFVEGKKYPLILYIHGGPHAMYGNTFFHEFQTLAARGYVVVFTNPRGSSGYGAAFGNSIQYNYPGDDYRDLMAAVDEILKRGYVDEKRMGVAGGSGGGLLTAWTVGHTTRFAAACAQRGVYDWMSFVLTSDANLMFVQRWFRSPPWKDAGEYARRSPVTYADKITTPLLILHNEEDWRSPISQGEELYTALKILKREVKMVRFPQEPHGMSRMGRPSHRVARLNYIAEWMDKYLKPGM